MEAVNVVCGFGPQLLACRRRNGYGPPPSGCGAGRSQHVAGGVPGPNSEIPFALQVSENKRQSTRPGSTFFWILNCQHGVREGPNYNSSESLGGSRQLSFRYLGPAAFEAYIPI